MTQELILRDGTRAFGRIESVDGDRIIFKTTAGAVLDVTASQIAEVRTAKGIAAGGGFRPADPNPTRLFFGPTGRSLPAGSGYVGVYEVVLPFVQVGVTDWFSIGAGTPLIFDGGSDHPIWLTPKFQIVDRPRTQIAVGIMHFFNVEDGNLGIAYGVVTQGSADTAFTIGGGFGYDTSSGTTDSPGIFLFGFEHRLSRRVKLISENYVLQDAGLLSLGVRFLGERLSADLGLVTPVNAEESVVFPMVNFVWQFGRR